MTATPKDQYEVVIIGGGIAGASAAYHLAKLGKTDIALLERHQLTSGTTWHAAGLIMQLRSTHAMTELAKYNVELYSTLEAETGRATGFKQNGTLGVCRTRDRLFETRKAASIAKSFGIEAHMLSPAEAQEIYPAMDPSVIEGAIYIPKDGQTNPVDTCMSLITGARQHGVSVFETTGVQTVERLPGGEYRVTTGVGEIRCQKRVVPVQLPHRNAVGPGRPLRMHQHVEAEHPRAAQPGMGQRHLPGRPHRLPVDGSQRDSQRIGNPQSSHFRRVRLYGAGCRRKRGDAPGQLPFPR